MRRRWRWLGVVGLVLALGHGLLIMAKVPVAGPYDWLLNLGPAITAPEFAVPADGRRRLCVLVHGMFRTSASLGRLERTLAAHGYATLAFDYPSNAAPLEAHAGRLRAALQAAWQAQPWDELYLVGHSMGGLVIHEYLRSPGAFEPSRCVHLAVPHRGAVLADLRKRWFLFRWAMGDTGALQLSPGDPFHRRPLVLPGAVGTLAGSIAPVLNGSAAIPGPDDGTVGVFEARLEGATDHLQLPVGHTAITTDPAAIRAVLAFLRTGGFAAVRQIR